MTGRLAFYVVRLFLARAIGAILVFAALMQVLDLIDGATEVMERGRGLSGIGYYALLRLPVILEQTFPLGVLVGALLTFAGLARHNEIVVMRMAGIPVARLVLALLPPVVAIAALHLVIADQVVPQVERQLAIWWEKEPGDGDSTGKTVWLRMEGDLVAVDRVAQAGTRLDGVRIYRRDANDQLDLRISAAQAILEDGAWRLVGASESRLADGRITVSPAVDRPWDVQLAPSDLIELTMPFAHISAAAARSALAGEHPTVRPPAFYGTRLQRALAEPLGALVMLLLATPASTGNQRAGQAGRRLLAGLGLGMLFLLADGILTAMGEAGRIPPVLAAWGAFGFFGCVGATILIHLDG